MNLGNLNFLLLLIYSVQEYWPKGILVYGGLHCIGVKRED